MQPIEKVTRAYFVDSMASMIPREKLEELFDSQVDDCYERSIELSCVPDAYDPILDFIVTTAEGEYTDEEYDLQMRRLYAGAVYDLSYQVVAYDNL